MVGEACAVRTGDRIEHVRVGQVDPRAHNIGQRGTGLFERRFDDVEAARGLYFGVRVDRAVRPRRRRATDDDSVADDHGAAVAHDGFER